MQISQLNSIDYVYIIFILFFLYKGYTANFINQVFPIIAILLGLYFAYSFSPMFTHYLVDPIFKKNISLFKTKFSIGEAFVFIFIFILVNFFVNRLAQYLNAVLSFLYLNWLNVVLGILFALLKGALILILIVSILDSISFPILEDDFFNSQITFYILLFKQQISELVQKYLKPYKPYI